MAGQAEEKKLSRSQRRRRDDILRAALKIFDQHGFEAVKMADVAEEAEVAKGTLYLYFETKSALLEGVVETAIMPTLQKIGEMAQTHSGSARDLLVQQMQVAAARMASPEMKMLLRLMISGGSRHSGIVDFYYNNVVQSGLNHFKSTLDQGVASGEFRPEMGGIDPLVLVGAPIYTAVWNILFEEKQSIDADQLVNDHLELVLKGILKEP
ncbi:MAG: TetR/AcrR family transcriptional regulator [Pseudomonadota bacterium]